MLKKNAWIAALFLALVMVFAGCVEPPAEGPSTGEWQVLYDLSEDEFIQAIPVGTTILGDNLGTLVRAGDDAAVEIKTVAGPSGQAVSLQFTTGVAWGSGIDLRNSEFGFQTGDKITVSGFFTGSGYVQLNSQMNNERPIAKHEGAGAFTLEATLVAADLGYIRNSDPPTIRIEGRASDVTVKIDSIVVEGRRGSSVKLAAPVLSTSATGVSWTAVQGAGGYNVYAQELMLEPGSTTVYEPRESAAPILFQAAASDTSLRLDWEHDTLKASTKYQIKIVATGIRGESTDSDESNAVNFDKGAIPAPIEIEVTLSSSGPPVTVTAYVTAVRGTLAVVEDASNNPIGYTFTRGAAYGSSYAYFTFDFPAGESVGDYNQVTATYQAVGGDTNYKDLDLIASTTPFTGSIPAANRINYQRYDDWNSTGGGATTGAPAFGGAFQTNDTTSVLSPVFRLNPAAIERLSAPAAGGTEALSYFSIYFGASASSGNPAVATAFSISNIEFSATQPSKQVVYVLRSGSTQIGYGNGNVAHGGIIANAPASAANATFYNRFFGSSGPGYGKQIIGWELADGTDFVFGTTPVTTDIILYAILGGNVPLATVTTKAIAGLTLPIAGATAVTSIDNAQYYADVTWSPALAAAADGKLTLFELGKTYTATVNLVAKPGYTFEGITANFFTVARSTTVTNAKNSGRVTVVFPEAQEPLDPVVLTGNQISFVGSGSVTGVTGNTFNFFTIDENGDPIADAAVITYTFPASVSEYNNIAIEYTLTPVPDADEDGTADADSTNPMKVTVKRSDNSDAAYPQAASTAAANLKYPSGSDASVPIAGLGTSIGFAHNTYGGGSSSFTITITKVTFTQ